MKTKRQHFEERLKTFQEESKQLSLRLRRLEALRLLTALTSLALIIAALEVQSLPFIGGALLSLLIFGALIVLYTKLDRQFNFSSALEKRGEEYCHRFTEEWRKFKDTGEEFMEETHPEAKDLGILGEGSLYQYLNVGRTYPGRKKLSHRLLEGAGDLDEILRTQEALRELEGKEDFVLEIQAYTGLMTMEEGDLREILERFIEEGERKKRTLPKTLSILKFILPLITLLSLGLAASGTTGDGGILFTLGLLLIQLLLFVYNFIKRDQILKPVYAFSKAIGQYEKIFKRILAEDFESQELQAIKGSLQEGGDITHHLRELRLLKYAWELRRNEFLYLIVAILFLWDYFVIDACDRWKIKHGSSIRGWIDSVGKLEMLMSLGALSSVKEEYIYPELEESASPHVAFEDLKHPLIGEDAFVGNDFTLDPRTYIITGSNMSGKTTFLRSIGINLLLAYSGGVVMAKSFRGTPMKVFTSMNIEDNVLKGISTFYGEILRIKKMIESLDKKVPMICLIDEIFKGTNSADRITGAVETIRRLTRPWCITLVSTHDFELCELEKEEDIRAVNYHFTESYEEDRILFDYKIREGRSRTTNARYLLKMAGIIEEV